KSTRDSSSRRLSKKQSGRSSSAGSISVRCTPDVAYSTSRLGTLAYYQGQYDRAEMLFGDALRIFEATLGPNRLEVAQALNDLASILLQGKGNYVQPEPMFRRALAIGEKIQASTKNSPPAADLQALLDEVLNNLGRLYYLRGDYDRAASQY